MRPRPPAAAALAALALLLASASGCSTCNDKALEGKGDAGEHQTSASLTPEQAAKVLVRVGDKTITLGDYVATLEHMDQFDRLRYQSPERRKELLKEMINVELLAQEAQAKGYDKDPVAQQDERTILRDALLDQARKSAPAPQDIPEADVRAYYDAHKADYKDPERRRVSVVVTKDEATANAALEQAKKGATAAQWGELVRTKSVDPQAKANVPIDLAGDLGMVGPPGDSRGDNARVPEEVREALFQIPDVGGVGDHVVRADGKFWLVRFSQKAEAHERSLQEAERTIRIKLAQDKIHEKEQELLNQLRAQFPVQIDDNALANVKVDLDAGAAHD